MHCSFYVKAGNCVDSAQATATQYIKAEDTC